MPSESSPYLVRDGSAAEPGSHSHNSARRVPLRLPPKRKLLGLRLALFTLGIAAIGYYGYNVVNERVYQAYENWSFDQQIAGRSPIDFADYVREQTPFGFLVGDKKVSPVERPSREEQPSQPAIVSPPQGSVLGRVEIARLNISAMVREGVDAATLSRSVGHVPSTALAGQPGNFAIAAHRDTLFRGLKNIQAGDQVVFQSPAGKFAYRVIATQVVRPSDVSVLRSDGGPRLLQEVANRPAKLLTMITCYPFNYIGSAPQRFIVQAEATEEPPPPVRTSAAHIAKPVPVAQALKYPLPTRAMPSRPPPRTVWQTSTLQRENQQKRRKPGFWHRLFRIT